jgi:hypothetical protein
VKLDQINQYLRGEQITTTKDGVKSSNNEIDDYFIIA